MLFSSLGRWSFILLCSSLLAGEQLWCEQKVTKGNTWKEALSQVRHDDRRDLERYLRSRCLEAEGGYVLFGAKPVFLDSIDDATRCPGLNFSFSNPPKLPFEHFRRGLEVWNSMPVSNSSPDVIIVCYDRPNPLTLNSRHVLWIHRQAFLETVNQNLSLFKAILGPEVSAESLLKELADPKQSFWSTLADNKILIGIVLGFGPQNSIFETRRELIDLALQEEERVPLARRAIRAGVSQSPVTVASFKGMGFGMGFPLSESELRPSLGYKSLEEEREALNAQMDISQALMRRAAPPIPLFGCLKNDLETTRILEKYAETQKKIQDLLAADNFLERALSLIGGKSPSLSVKTRGVANLPRALETSLIKVRETSTGGLSDCMAQLIYNNLVESDENYVARFLEGMQAAENEPEVTKGYNYREQRQRMAPISEYVAALNLIKTRRNLAEGSEALRMMAQNQDVQEVVPTGLYYKTMKRGNGQEITKNVNQVTVKYSLTRLTGKNAGEVIASSLFLVADVSDLFPGLAHGLLGMQKGEVREIYIHADYAYGCFSKFEPGLTLGAKVELLSFASSDERAVDKFPSLVPLDQEVRRLPIAEEVELVQLRKRAAYAEGHIAWSFYRMGKDLYSFQEITKKLQTLAENPPAGKEIELNPVVHDLLAILYYRSTPNAVK